MLSGLASGSEVVIEGDNVSFYCNASAYPQPIGFWSKLSADDFAVVVSHWLNLSDIGTDKAGDCICVANNTFMENY